MWSWKSWCEVGWGLNWLSWVELRFVGVKFLRSCELLESLWADNTNPKRKNRILSRQSSIENHPIHPGCNRHHQPKPTHVSRILVGFAAPASRWSGVAGDPHAPHGHLPSPRVVREEASKVELGTLGMRWLLSGKFIGHTLPYNNRPDPPKNKALVKGLWIMIVVTIVV